MSEKTLLIDGSKASIVTYFQKLAEQAAFDGDGNAEAMFIGLKNDVLTVTPDSVFELRESFFNGDEQRARDAATAPVTEPLAPSTTVGEDTVTVDPQPAEPAGVSAETQPDPTAPVAETPPDSAPVSEPASEPPPVEEKPAEPPLTDAAHEATQDERLRKLEEAQAAAVAGKFAPNNS